MSKKMFSKIVSVFFIIVLACSAFVGCGSKKVDDKKNDAAKVEKKKEIVLTVMTSSHPYFQAIIGGWEKIAQEKGFKLTVMDPNSDNSKQQKIVEDIIAKNPDGVAFAPIDSKISVKMLNKINEAGIPVVAYNVKPAEDVVPVAVGGNYNGGVTAGEASAKFWKEKNPDKEPVIGIVGMVGIPEVDQREQGFIEGFKKVYPNALLKQKVNGYGARDKALKASEDLLQANPDINIIFGINDDSALAATDALKEINRNSYKEAVVAGIDGSEPSIRKIKESESAYKIEVGNPPKDMADYTYELLDEVMSGKKDFQEKEIPFVLISPEEGDQWLEVQFPKK